MGLIPDSGEEKVAGIVFGGLDLFWPAARLERDFQSWAFDDSLGPIGISKRCASMDAASQR